MRTATLRFLSSIAFILGLAAAISGTSDEELLTAWYLFLIFAAIPMFVLSWMEFGKSLRGLSDPSLGARLLGMIFGVPQALFGVLSIVVGLSIIGWVLYNLFVEAQPEYRHRFLFFGGGSSFVVVGIYWVRAAFRQEAPKSEAPKR